MFLGDTLSPFRVSERRPMLIEDRVEEVENNLLTTNEELEMVKTVLGQVIDVIGGNFDKETLAQFSAQTDLDE